MRGDRLQGSGKLGVEVEHGEGPYATFYVERQEWADRAQCNHADPSLFFDYDKQGKGITEQKRAALYRDAIGLCHSCPVRRECGEQAMIEEGKAPYGRWGIRGAMTPSQREVIFRRGGLAGRDPASLVAGRDGQRRVPPIPRKGMPWSRHHQTLLRKLGIVLAERLAVGDRLPDVAKLASILGCNATPLKHVLTEAWAVGIVDKAPRGFVYRGDSQPNPRRQRSPHA